MKTMKNKLLLAMLAVVGIAESQAAESTASLVVTYPASEFQLSQQSTQGNSASLNNVCVSVNGQPLCVQKKNTSQPSVMVASMARTKNEPQLTSSTVSLPDGMDVSAAVQALKQTSQFTAVELNVMVDNGTEQPKNYPDGWLVSSQAYPAGTPDDPEFKEQIYFNSVKSSPSALGFLDAWKKVKTASPIDVVVIDGGFLNRADLEYASGYDFMTYNNNVRSANFLEPTADMCTGHGTGVSSVIGAKINNGLLISGAVDGAKIHAIKTMTCFRGVLSDTADALRWLAGEEFPGIPAYTGKPGVVNMSLGGLINSCPVYLQNAINMVTQKGFSVVVAAGNNNVDASGMTPANCSGVTVVGALQKDGTRAAFSNFGSKLTVSAIGVDVVGLCHTDGSYCFWEGTSFSSPLVAAGVAIARQYSALPATATNVALMLSSAALQTGGECADKGCGAGRMDTPALLDVSAALGSATASTATYLLSKETKCSQQWLKKFAGSVKLCDVLRVTAPSLTVQGKTIELTLEAKTTGEWVKVGTFDSTEMLVTISDLNSKLSSSLSSPQLSDVSLQVKMCSGGVCGVIPTDVSGLAADKAPNCN